MAQGLYLQSPDALAMNVEKTNLNRQDAKAPRKSREDKNPIGLPGSVDVRKYGYRTAYVPARSA